MKKYVSTLIVSFCLYQAFVNGVSAQVVCDPLLTRRSDSPLGYTKRGDRCEGLYVREVGSTTLFIASFTESFEKYDVRSEKPLQIEWDKTPGNNAIRLRAQSIKSKLYYRMDTYQQYRVQRYTWSPDILSSLNIQKEDIGVVGVTEYVIEKTKHDVYVPLRISQQENSNHSGSYKLILVPGVELSEVYISLAMTDSSGKSKNFIKDGEKLEYGYYPADRGIEIPITGLTQKGLYYLEIGATLRSGGTSTIDLWFYKPSAEQ